MSTQVDDRRVFLSYNHADVAVARSVGAHLALASVEVWFDEWKIKAGDSIPGRLNEGLVPRRSEFDRFTFRPPPLDRGPRQSIKTTAPGY